MATRILRPCAVLLALSCGQLPADSCIESGSTNRTFSAQALSSVFSEFDSGPSSTGVSMPISDLESRVFTRDVSSGRNLARAPGYLVISFR